MTVRELFSRLRGRDAHVLVGEPGRGDLRGLGLQALCRSFDVRANELESPYPARGEVLLVDAAEDLCVAADPTARRLLPYLDAFREIYILPCSLDLHAPGVEAFVRALPEHVEVFACEPYSFAKARFAIDADARVHLDHDLAFARDYRGWSAPGGGTIETFEDDPGVLAPAVCAEELPRLLQHFAVVRTDRAPVAICAALLGKETHLYPGDRDTLRGIFEFSLRTFANVRFHGFDETSIGANA
jgi:hypothetical protein